MPADPDGKKQHVVEVLNGVDTGTSILVDAQVQSDFTAQTTVEAVVRTLRATGCPASITLDRDSRFVGNPQGSDFPAPLVRLLLCLGIQVHICPPRRPDKNAFVERYHCTRRVSACGLCDRTTWPTHARRVARFGSTTIGSAQTRP